VIDVAYRSPQSGRHLVQAEHSPEGSAERGYQCGTRVHDDNITNKSPRTREL